MACLSPAAIRLIRMVSDEVSPVMACNSRHCGKGRLRPSEHVKHWKIPKKTSHVPLRQARTRGCSSCHFLLSSREPMRQFKVIFY